MHSHTVTFLMGILLIKENRNDVLLDEEEKMNSDRRTEVIFTPHEKRGQKESLHVVFFFQTVIYKSAKQ